MIDKQILKAIQENKPELCEIIRETELANARVMLKIMDEIQADLDDVKVSWKTMDFCDNTLVIKINIEETLENGFMER